MKNLNNEIFPEHYIAIDVRYDRDKKEWQFLNVHLKFKYCIFGTEHFIFNTMCDFKCYISDIFEPVTFLVNTKPFK